MSTLLSNRLNKTNEAEVKVSRDTGINFLLPRQLRHINPLPILWVGSLLPERRFASFYDQQIVRVSWLFDYEVSC